MTIAERRKESTCLSFLCYYNSATIHLILEEERMSSYQIASALIQHSVAKFGESFSYSAGGKGPVYVNVRKAMGSVSLRDTITGNLVDAVHSCASEDDLVIAGVVSGGVAWAALIADRLRVPMVSVRPEPKAHGVDDIDSDYLTGRARVVVIEDTIRSGASVLKVYERLRRYDIATTNVVSVVSYGFGSFKARISELGVTALSLTTVSEMLDISCAAGHVEKRVESEVRSWLAAQ